MIAARVALVLGLSLLIMPSAHAQVSTWTSLPGLTAASGAQCIRAFDYASVPPSKMYAATERQGVFRARPSVGAGCP